MRFGLLLLVGGSFLLLFTGNVSGNHLSRGHQPIPHMRDAEGESSVETTTVRFGKQEQIWRPRTTVGPVTDVNSLSVRFHLYNNPEKPEESNEIFVNDLISIQHAKPFPQSLTTEWKILVSGFPINGKSPFPKNVIEAYLKRMKNSPGERYNVLVVDWDKCACYPDFNFQNTTYTGAVGEKVADMLLYLEDQGLLTLQKDTHLIGFSLGAHVVGEATRFIFRKFNKQNLLFRATALDPAGRNFWPEKFSKMPMEKVPRIRRTFVGFLDAIHTNKEFGIGERKIGDIDFFVNDGNSQPGCQTSFFRPSKIKYFEDLCSHVFSTELFAYSIGDRTMKGCTGYDYRDLYKKNKNDCEDYPIIGEFVDEEKIDGFPIAVGKAFIDTGNLDDFGARFEANLLSLPKSTSTDCKWCVFCN